MDQGKHTIIFDNIGQGQVKSYLKSHLRNSCIVDFHMEKARVYIKEKSYEEAFEVLRSNLVKCMRTGQPLVINLEGLTVDFQNEFTNEYTFPSELVFDHDAWR